MMRYLFLACLQGVTEFLPVSSSGHLVFFQEIIGLKEPLLTFDIILHLATMFSVIVFLRKDILSILKESVIAFNKVVKGTSLKEVWSEFEYLRLFVFVIAAIIPAVLIGLLFHRYIEEMFSSFQVITLSFFATGTILFFTKGKGTHDKKKQLTLIDSLIIGLAQAVAIIPGISRSGLTISSGIFRGLDKELAARFSFLLSIPTIAAAAIYKLKNGLGELSIGNLELGLSFLAAFLSGYFALSVLSKMVARAKFHYFSFYCWGMGFICIAVLLKG
ncbi:MAG: undecaprenyl-diphosphate phosphatase [Candidatus Omnitrophica bacterium]|nr:undecaprenyl-diphosphate phosphatase [Candidatus Omnitrophota bacterium]